VQDGLVNLKAFQQLFSEYSPSSFGQQGSYSTNDEYVNLRTVSASHITEPPSEFAAISALQGVKNAMDIIQLKLVSSGLTAEEAPGSYLSPNIISLLSVDGEITTSEAATLTEYILANGISQNEIETLKNRFVNQQSSSQQSLYKILFMDTNGDQTVGSADLLDFLIAYNTSYESDDTMLTYQLDSDGELDVNSDGRYIIIEQTS
jgi:hypothetical protein